ncbi:pyridoxal phosphate-dependent transferase [Fimicolochytrium jonesii]|uniref:pyridoxal phosphate-dependent transferase n=1 Tax=Fimicolochytrium jonesii TaxID=1396493 RepID=UPI0022FEB3C4|nr:pyridoxal phosphate-dependent transferase [Fimicolochytrium jonesii]KAI8819350.1 pyridoxal phosphate-dependent transferase [Fimicolochytrium jonesii]
MQGTRGLPIESSQSGVPTTLETQLSVALSRRRAQNLLRSTPIPRQGLTDFSSNDYLGLARTPQLHSHFLSALQHQAPWQRRRFYPGSDDAYQSSNTTQLPRETLGSTGSRLLTGNSSTALDLEQYLADYHSSPSALLFNSGYDANLSLLSTLPQPDGGVLHDEFVHASMHDGIRMCRARRENVRSFRHNDVEDLENVLVHMLGSEEEAAQNGRKYCKTVVVAIESLYSMDGDIAPLREIATLLSRFDGRAILVVDEAHSTGTYGAGGRGLVSHLGLESKVFARLHTFGKAVGAHGAVVLGPAVLREYLCNYARPLVYSTMMAGHALLAIRCAYEVMEGEAEARQARLNGLIEVFKSAMRDLPPTVELLHSDTMVQGIVFPGNANVVMLAKVLQDKRFDVRPIRSPTVPVGTERVRVCLHAHNTAEEIQDLAVALRSALEELHPRAANPTKPTVVDPPTASLTPRL